MIVYEVSLNTYDGVWENKEFDIFITGKDALVIDDEYFIVLKKGYDGKVAPSTERFGKQGMDNHKPAKGYYDGLNQGYLNARRYIAKLFEKNLKVEIQGSDGVRKQRALEKFNDFINIDEETEEE